jgi:hypothetical protein
MAPGSEHSCGELANPLQLTSRVYDFEPKNNRVRLSHRAISYTCGSGDVKRKKMWLNDKLVPVDRSKFGNRLTMIAQEIQDSEFSVCKHSLFWCHTSCIDQQNKIGKTRKVRNMRAVYAQASQVWIWLGLSDESAHLAISQMKDIAESVIRRGTPRAWAAYNDREPTELLRDYRKAWSNFRAALLHAVLDDTGIRCRQIHVALVQQPVDQGTGPGVYLEHANMAWLCRVRDDYA